MSIIHRLEDKYRKYLEYNHANESDYDYSDYDYIVDQYQEALRDEFIKLSPEDRSELFRSLLSETRNELEDCFVENHTGRAIELMLLEQLLTQVVGADGK